MADLNYIEAAQEVKIVGQDSTGNRVNYVSADANGNLSVKDASDGPVTPGTVASFSQLIGGQFNSALPTLSSGQQSAFQLDSSGRVIIAPLTNTSIVKAQLQDNAGTAITLGQKTMASSVPVAIASDQSAFPVSQSGTWTTGRTWTLASGTDSVSAVQSGTWTVQQGTPPWQIVGNIASGSADSGNPVKVGGVFNTAFPTLTNGQRGDLQLDSSARLVIAPLTNASVVKAQLQDNAGTAITLGQKAMASSVPVVIASDQTHFPVELQDGAGNNITSQASGAQRALDVGINVSGTQVDPRQIRALTASDIVTAAQGSANTLSNKWPVQVTDGTNTMPTMDVAARAGFQKITDGTNVQAVKAGSTAAAAADPSAVVALSPNSPLPAGTNAIGAVKDSNFPTTVDTNYGTVGASTIRTASEIGNATGAADFNEGANSAQTLRVSANIARNGNELSYNNGASDANTLRTAPNLSDGSGNKITSDNNGNANNQRLHTAVPDTTTASAALGALNATVSVSLAALTGAGFQLAAGTLVGTLIAELSYDGGATYPLTTLFYNPQTQATQTSIVFGASNTATTLTVVVAGGVSNVRVRVSAYTSGTANATMRATQATSTQTTSAASQISAGTTFSVAVLALSAATTGTENPMLYIKNVGTNTKSIYFETSYAGTLTANRGGSFEVYSNPTVSANGTSQTIVNRTIGNANASQMSVFTAPTVTSNGALFSSIVLAQNASSVAIIDGFQLKIPPGNSILITCNPSSNATTFYMSVTWSEY